MGDDYEEERCDAWCSQKTEPPLTFEFVNAAWQHCPIKCTPSLQKVTILVRVGGAAALLSFGLLLTGSFGGCLEVILSMDAPSDGQSRAGRWWQCYAWCFYGLAGFL